ncbi:MAG: hypothetical protein ABI697_08580 [Devosia sp.]
MTIEPGIDWGSLAAYGRGPLPVPLGERVLELLIELLLAMRGRRHARAESVRAGQVRAFAQSLPAYLRRDLGLPPD